MRIAYYLHTSSATDGSSKAILYLLSSIRSMGVHPLVILAKNGDICPLLEKLHIPFVVLHWEARPSIYPWSKTLRQKLLFIPRLLGRFIINSLSTIHSVLIIFKFHPHIIHTNTSIFNIGYYTASLLHIPHIWHIREYGALDINTFYYYPTFNHQLRRYKKDNSYTLCITKDIQRYNRLTNWKNSKVLYDGVLPISCITYSLDKKPYFLFAGRFEPVKGILPLIDAYAAYCQIQPRPLPLHIAGSGTETYTRLVTDKIAHYHLEDKVTLLGMRSDILSLYKEAKAFIVPSLFEGFGFITAEAMFSGCLVIGNDTAGTKEQFDNGKELTGEEIALRYTTQEQLIQHFIDVTNNPIEYYKPMILRGQSVVKQLYSSEESAKQIYNFYQTILNNQEKR